MRSAFRVSALIARRNRRNKPMNQEDTQPARIQWAPKLRRARIYQIYKNDAQGSVDEELIGAVGFDLYRRCRSIL